MAADRVQHLHPGSTLATPAKRECDRQARSYACGKADS